MSFQMKENQEWGVNAPQYFKKSKCLPIAKCEKLFTLKKKKSNIKGILFFQLRKNNQHLYEKFRIQTDGDLSLIHSIVMFSKAFNEEGFGIQCSIYIWFDIILLN